MKKIIIVTILTLLSICVFSQSRIRKGFNSIQDGDTISLLYSNGIWSLISDTTFNIQTDTIKVLSGLSIGGGDVITSSDTIDLKTAVESESFDKINTDTINAVDTLIINANSIESVKMFDGGMIIKDSTLIIKDLPNRVEIYQVYYNPITGKLSYD